MPYAPYQGLGAYLLFFASTLWLSRSYLGRVVRRASGLAYDIDDSLEPLSHRAALLGLTAGLAALTLFCVALGMSWGYGAECVVARKGCRLPNLETYAREGTRKQAGI